VFLGSGDTVLELFIEESQALAVDAGLNAEGYTAVIWPANVGRQTCYTGENLGEGLPECTRRLGLRPRL